MERCDVLVVGGGLAGLSCARELAAGGLDTVLVDQKRDLGVRVHTTGIFVRRTLEDFALPDECLGPAIREVVLYSPARRSMRLVSPHDEFRVGKMAELYRRAQEEAERAGARVWTGCRLVAARPRTAGVDVELAGSGGARRLTARYWVSWASCPSHGYRRLLGVPRRPVAGGVAAVRATSSPAVCGRPHRRGRSHPDLDPIRGRAAPAHKCPGRSSALLSPGGATCRARCPIRSANKTVDRPRRSRAARRRWPSARICFSTDRNGRRNDRPNVRYCGQFARACPKYRMTGRICSRRVWRCVALR